ncbi:MAG: Gfo/Idh/MocA family oxidoreductase [Lachnospiraceae bacterium]|nr:Gfo/Idh/MocA family oxidoreductase [Lachnospiraceae bacterium]
MKQGKIRWGLLGAGEILNRWMKGARQVEDMEIAAVASRSRERAYTMAQKFQIPEAMSYEEMLAREDIDVVYIPVPHTAHRELAVRAMEAGKGVLVEKPAAINAGEFQEMVDCAKRNHVFLMEAVWTKFFPLMQELETRIGEGGIGQVRIVQSNFAFRNEVDPASRLFDVNRAGGGLLDVGVYNLHFSRMILKKDPIHLIGKASMDTDEYHLLIDEQAAYIAQYDGGELAVMASGVRTGMLDTAWIYGTKGYITVPHFWKPTQMLVTVGDETWNVERRVSQKIAGMEDEGYQYEIAHVDQCIREGIIESPVVKWEDTLAVLKQCDSLRADWGIVYPQEEGSL